MNMQCLNKWRIELFRSQKTVRMIASFKNHQFKMTAQNSRSALPFAVFTFLLVLIATFGVVLRYDLYPGYGTLVHIGLYHNPNISTTVKSEMSAEDIRALEPSKVHTMTHHQGINTEPHTITPSKLDEDVFDKIFAVFGSVKSRPSESTNANNEDEVPNTTGTPFANRDHVKFPGGVHESHISSKDKPIRKEMYPDGSKSMVANPDKIQDAIQKQQESVHPNGPSYRQSLYDHLIARVSQDLAGGSMPIQIRNEQKLGDTRQHHENVVPISSRRGRPQTPLWIVHSPQGHTAWMEEILANAPEKKMDGRTISTALSGLENFFDDLGEELSSEFELPESFELPDLVGLFDDVGTSMEATEESDSDEQYLFFGRNPKHFVTESESLPQFPHPVVDFPLNIRN